MRKDFVKAVSLDNTKVDRKPLSFTMVPGETKFVTFSLPFESEFYDLICEGEKMTFSIDKGKIKAFIAVPYHYEKELFSCSLKGQKGFLKTILNATVKKVKYKTSYIDVPKRKVDLTPSDIQWYLKDKEELKKIYSNLDTNKAYFNQAFLKPLNSKVTSPYGAKRIFNNKKSSWHNGIDFRAKVGTPIPSSNRGKVILVRHLFFNGKTVIVDHGMNIISLYCHLSDYNVQVGDIVERGDIIGQGGNTGRSSGPHLHWGMRIQGHWVNGFSLVEQSELAI